MGLTLVSTCTTGATSSPTERQYHVKKDDFGEKQWVVVDRVYTAR